MVTASAVDQALEFNEFIRIFNQYIIKGQPVASIEPRDAIQTLYEADVDRIIPWLVISGLLLNRPMNKLLQAIDTVFYS